MPGRSDPAHVRPSRLRRHRRHLVRRMHLRFQDPGNRLRLIMDAIVHMVRVPLSRRWSRRHHPTPEWTGSLEYSLVPPPRNHPHDIRSPVGALPRRCTPRSATPRRVGAGFKPARSIHARSTRARLLSSRAKPRDLKTIALRQPSKSPHNPRPDPRHTGAGRYPEVPGWTQSRPNDFPRCATPPA